MTMMDWVVKIHLCAIAAMIVMGAAGLVRNAYRSLRNLEPVSSEEQRELQKERSAEIRVMYERLATEHPDLTWDELRSFAAEHELDAIDEKYRRRGLWLA